MTEPESAEVLFKEEMSIYALEDVSVCSDNFLVGHKEVK